MAQKTVDPAEIRRQQQELLRKINEDKDLQKEMARVIADMFAHLRGYQPGNQGVAAGEAAAWAVGVAVTALAPLGKQFLILLNEQGIQEP
jgi:peptide deformylase